MSRAGVLVASAALGSALLGIAEVEQFMVVVALAFSFAAALCGTLALFPSRAKYVLLDEVRTELYSRAAARGSLWLFDNKAAFYNSAIVRMRWRGWTLIVGYSFLTLAVLFAMLGIARR